jgi:hypothetical protein
MCLFLMAVNYREKMVSTFEQKLLPIFSNLIIEIKKFKKGSHKTTTTTNTTTVRGKKELSNHPRQQQQPKIFIHFIYEIR